MATPDQIRTQQATERIPLSIALIQAGETQNFSRVTRDAHPTRNTPLSYPRIPRLVSKSAKSARSSLDSQQFQVNASRVQKPLSLIVPVKHLLSLLVLTLSSQHVRMKAPKRAVWYQPHDAARRFGMPVKSKRPSLSNVRPFLSYTRRPGDRPLWIHRPVLSNTRQAGASLPLRSTGNRASGGIVGPHRQRTATTRIPSTSTASSLRLRPSGRTTAPAARSRLPFFAARRSCRSTQPPSPRRTDSAFCASVRPRRRSLCRRSAMRRDGAGACAFPRAGCLRTWSTCSRSSRSSLMSWARRCRG